MSGSPYDAIVVGAGPNGLVAANHLVDAGWSVLVLEEQPEPGGAVRSDRDVHPAYVHDTFSSFYPLAAASPAIASLGLEQYGLVWRHAPAVQGHPLPDGRWALMHRDRAVTATLMDELCPGDGDAWLRLCAQWDVVGEALVHALLSPIPPVRGGMSLLARLRKAGGLELLRTLLTPAARLGHGRFGGFAPTALLAGNAGHADIPLTAPGSGLMGLMLSMLGQSAGFPVPQGGASGLTTALVRRFRERGGELRCSASVSRVDVVDERAAGVRTADGDLVRARLAVVADVIASKLYARLLPVDTLPRRVTRAMDRFELDPATIKVDWALDGVVPWASPPPYAPGTLHIADSLPQMSASLQQVAAGVIPDRPFLLAGQMTTTDATRSPAGTESMWAYTHVPQSTVGDAGDDDLSGRWDDDELERFADRIQDRMEALAPGFAARVSARRVIGPAEFERRDANLVGGALNGGTAQLHQQAVFRPIPGLGRAETPIAGLYLGSASAHPGGGVHGAAGMNAARAALAHARLRHPIWTSSRTFSARTGSRNR